MKAKAQILFKLAKEELGQANQNLYRPEEDVVAFAVCRNAQFAIENYLKGYLLLNGVNPVERTTIESLFKQCKSINKRFKEVDLSNLTCIADPINSKSCRSVEKVGNCFAAADNLDSFLKQEKII